MYDGDLDLMVDAMIWAVVFGDEGTYDITIDDSLYAGVEYTLAVYGTGENDEEFAWNKTFTTEATDSPAVEFNITVVDKEVLTNDEITDLICSLAMELGLPITDIATVDGLNCMMYLMAPPVDEEPTGNDSNSTRRLQTTTDTNDTNGTNETNQTTDKTTTIEVVILPNIDPRANPGVSTDDILALDTVSLKELVEEALGSDYDVSGVTAPVTYPILPVEVQDNHGYTASADTDSITIKGLLTDNTGVVCWILYQGDDDALTSDVAQGMYHGKEAVDHGCQEVDATVDGDDTVTIGGLSDATDYVLAYTVRSADHRVYAQTSDVYYEDITTQTIVIPTGDEEEEFSFLTTFGFLSFLLLIVFNA